MQEGQNSLWYIEDKYGEENSPILVITVAKDEAKSRF